MIDLILGLSGFLGIVSSMAMGFGSLLLAIWAFKFMSKEGLWKWGWIMLIGGVVVTFVVGAVVNMAMNGVPNLEDVPMPGDSAWSD